MDQTTGIAAFPVDKNRPTQHGVVALSSTTGNLNDSPKTTGTLQTLREMRETRTFANSGSDRVSEWLLLIWAAGALVAYWPWLMGRRFVRSLQKNSKEINDPDFQQELLCLCRRLGIRSAVRVLQSSATTTPMTWGIVSPVILFPAQWRVWPRGAWQAALLHELAHIQRRDVVCQWIARLTCAVYWFHPLVWHAARRLKVEREMACDDCVISFGQTASDYASHLVTIAKGCLGRVPSVAISMAQSTGLEQRVRALLDNKRLHHPLTMRTSAIIFSLIFLLAVPLLVVQASLVQEYAVATNVDDRTIESHVTLSSDNELEFAGKVLGPDGQPVEGARLFLIPNEDDIMMIGLPSVLVPPVGSTGADGSFAFVINPRTYGGSWGGWSMLQIVATKEGFGLTTDSAWIFEKSGMGLTAVDGSVREYRQSVWERHDRTLRLTVDDAPVEGVVLDKEDRPVQGARITLLSLAGGSAESLDEWEAGAGQPDANWWSTENHLKNKPGNIWVYGNRLSSVIPPVHTDANGRFVMHGLGRDRIARLAISHPRRQYLSLLVRTRDGATVGVPTGRQISTPSKKEPELIPCYPRRFEVVTERSVPVTGTITDSVSGQPVVGAIVASGSQFGNGARAVTDATGRYELHGIAATDHSGVFPYELHPITIFPPNGSRWFPARLTPRVDVRQQSHVFDLQLKPGIMIRGRVINKLTGEPILGTVYGVADEDTPNVVEYLAGGPTLHPRARTEFDGSFQLATAPGKFRLGFMADQFHSFERAPLLPIGERARHPLSGMQMSYSTELNLGQADETIPDIQLSPAATVEIQLQDPSGNAITDVTYTGGQGAYSRVLFRSRIVVQLDPRENLHEYFIHQPGSGNAAKVTLAPTVESPVIVRLAPAATAHGRLVDQSGNPIARARLVGKGLMRPVTSAEIARSDYVDPMPQTDIDGRFELAGLVPGETYQYYFSGPGPIVSNEITVVVTSTEPIDLGEVTCWSPVSEGRPVSTISYQLPR